MPRKINLADKLSRIDEHFAQKLVATLDDQEVKLAKIKGEFVWHAHEGHDELFLVIDGQLTVHTRAGDEHLGPGEMIVIPAGEEHKTSAEETCSILVMGHKDLVNTGSGGPTERTRKAERI